MSTWNNQSLVFNYYFPSYGTVFTGSPISFVADGSHTLSTLANIEPATFYVSLIAPNMEQIAYVYPLAAYPQGFPLTNAAFNGFTISGPLNDAPIVSAFVDSGSTATGLSNSEVTFTANSVSVNLAGDTFTAGSIGLIDVQFDVPEAGSLPLLSSGLLVLLALTCLRRQVASASRAA